MTIKSLLKVTLSALLLLGAGTTAYAVETAGTGETTVDNEPAVVRLSDGTIISWTKFAKAINDPTSIVGEVSDEALQKAKKAYDDAVDAVNNAPTASEAAQAATKKAKANYDQANKELTELNTKMSKLDPKNAPASWLSTISSKGETFSAEYKAYYQAKVEPENPKNYEISYKYIKDDEELYIGLTPCESLTLDGYTTVTTKVFAEKMKKGEEITSVSFMYVNLSPNYTVKVVEADYGTALTLGTKVSNAINTFVAMAATDPDFLEPTDAFTELEKQIEEKSAEVERLLGEWNTAIAEENSTINSLTQLQANVTTTKATYDAALAAYNDDVSKAQEEGILKYKDVTLTDNFTAQVAITKTYDGTIKSEGTPCIITNGVTGALFTSFTGSLNNVGINGTFATASSGARGSVANWNGSTGVFYDANGDRTNCKTIGELGYAARELFGISFDDGGKLVDKASNTTVYSITAYTSPTVATPYFALLNGTTFVTASGDLKVSENTLIKSEDPLDTVDNVFYSDGGKYVCQRMVITDKKDFYAPVEISAAEVVYDRVFTPGNMHAVCLPFELNYQNYLDEVKSLCTYESESKNTFWFVKREGTVAANTPMLLTTTGNFDLKNLANVTIKQTPAEQKVWTDGTDGTRAYGTFAKVNRGELAGEEAASEFKIYGLTVNSDGKQVFRPAGKDATFTAFRMAILSNESLTAAGAPSAMRRIGILDEKGVEITDEVISAVESVVAPESSLKVLGGQGVIRFSSDCDYGKVAVYSLDGRMITVAEVVEGTTTVDVNSGIYIVEGKKIQVK